MVVRVQAQDESWVWLYMVLQLQPGEIPISSNNYIIRYFFFCHFADKRPIKGENMIVTPNFSFVFLPSLL